MQHKKSSFARMHSQKHSLLLWDCCLCWTQHKNYEESKEATEENFQRYEENELYALHSVWLLVHFNLHMVYTFNDLDETKQGYSLLHRYSRRIRLEEMVCTVHDLPSSLQSHDSDFSLCDYRNAQAVAG